ncbi:MAG: C4-dicarboxylate ABC transporter [Gammaproteobacteria bacterium]|nr:C4-dicarboxylate ABC transporter [Gammaproteobacteria bacterium]
METASSSRLAHFPVSFFAMVMGLAGLTLAWEKAQQVFARDLGLTPWLLGLTTLVFASLLLIYATKLVRQPQAVVQELRHPVKLNFFPTISMSLILLANASAAVQPVLGEPLWILGTTLHLLFTLYVMNVWIHHEHLQIHHMNPAWFIPAVGNLLVPILGVSLGYTDVAWFFFSIGILFWIVLLTIVFNRMLFHHPIEAHLLPTLFILIAPPAIGFIAYVKLTGGLDPFARVLYFAALYLTLLLFTQIGRFFRLPFALSWWAYSFPLAAISLASFLMFELTGQVFYQALATGFLVLLSAVVVFLLLRTLLAVSRQGICVPGH